MKRPICKEIDGIAYPNVVFKMAWPFVCGYIVCIHTLRYIHFKNLRAHCLNANSTLLQLRVARRSLLSRMSRHTRRESAYDTFQEGCEPNRNRWLGAVHANYSLRTGANRNWNGIFVNRNRHEPELDLFLEPPEPDLFLDP